MVHALVLDRGFSRQRLRASLERYAPTQTVSDPHSLPTATAAATLIHPGVGPESEEAAFYTRAHDRGLIPLMPHPKHLAWCANKLELLRSAESQGLRTLLLHEEPVANLAELENLIESRGLRFPLVLRAVFGGGSQGVWVVKDHQDLREKAPRWLDLLRLKQSQPLVFLERFLSESRHWVLGFCRRASGEVQFPWLSEASLQSRCRKLIEWHVPADLGPSLFGAERLDDKTLREMKDSAERLLAHVGFVGVGAMEFLADPTGPHLVEVLPRLPTHWAAWEEASGIDPIAFQLEVYTGESFAEAPRAHAPWVGVARVIAEDAMLELPRPGEVHELRAPDAPAWVSDLQKGSRSPAGDSILGVVLGRGESFDDARRALLAQLDALWVAGTVATNSRALRELLEHPFVREMHFHAGFVDEDFVPTLQPPESVVSAVRAALAAAPGPDGSLRADGVVGYPLPADPRRVRFRAGIWGIDARRKGASTAPAGVLELRALCGGTVRALFFREGARIPAHESALWIESLRQLVPHALPRDLSLERWLVSPGTAVAEGQVLAWLRAV